MSDKKSNAEVQEKYLLNLQELLETLQPQLKELEALTQVEEFVTNLESTDPHFHRYNFVSQIKDTLDSELTPMIEHLLIDGEKEENKENLINNISKDLIKTEEFQTVSATITKCVQSAAGTVTDHLNSRTFNFSNKSHRKPRSSSDFFNTSHSDCSTLDGMDYMFMPPEQYISLAKNIDPLKPIELRLKTFSILQQVPQGDLVASKAWELTKEGIQRALNDDNEEINSRALKLVSRLFVTGSSHVIKEYFLLLIENLKEYFLDSTSHMVSISSGLDLGDRRNALLLRKFRLLNEIQRELPTTWLRYSESYVEEMVEALVDLLGVSAPKIHINSISCMNPFHFLSLVDPQAVWFKKWAHGFYSRSYLISSVGKHVSFLKRPIKSCFEVCRKLHTSSTENIHENSTNNLSNEMAFDQNDILYIQLIHSINILTRLMQSKHGRELFSFELNNGRLLDMGMLIVALVDIMKLHPITGGKTTHHAGYLIVDGFQTLCRSDALTINSCFCFDNMYQSIALAFYKDAPALALVMDMLTQLASSKEGCSQVLLSRKLDGYEDPVSLLDLIASLYIKERRNAIHKSLLRPLLKFLQNMLKDSRGVDQLIKYNFNLFLANLYREQKEESNALLEKCKQTSSTPLSSSGSGSARRSTESQAHKKSLKLENQILRTALCLTLTSKGFCLFKKSEFIGECVLFLTRYLQEKARTPTNCFGIMMSKVCSINEGMKALINSGKFTLQSLSV